MLLARCADTCLWSRGQRIASPGGSWTHSDPSPSACWVLGWWQSSLGLCTPRQVLYPWSVPRSQPQRFLQRSRVTLLMDVTNTWPTTEGRRGLFLSPNSRVQFISQGRHDGSWSQREKECPAHFLLFIQLGIIAHGIVPLTLGVHLSNSVNPI